MAQYSSLVDADGGHSPADIHQSNSSVAFHVTEYGPGYCLGLEVLFGDGNLKAVEYLVQCSYGLVSSDEDLEFAFDGRAKRPYHFLFTQRHSFIYREGLCHHSKDALFERIRQGIGVQRKCSQVPEFLAGDVFVGRRPVHFH